MGQIEDNARNWAAGSAVVAREGIATGDARTLRLYLTIETRASLKAAATKRLAELEAAGPVKRKKSLAEPSTDAAFAKVRAKTKERAAEIGEVPAVVETIETITVPTPTPDEPVRKMSGFAPKSKPAAPLAKKTKTEARTDAFEVADRPARVGFTDAEIAAALAYYGENVACTKCGAAGPLIQHLGLRRINGRVLKQPQCRSCRNAAAKASAKKG